MIRIFQRLHRIQIRNKSLKLLSLAIAVMVYVVSRQPMTNVRFSDISLDTTGLSPDLVITGKTPQNVSVSFHGPRDVIRSITPNQLIVTADLTGKGAGERVIQLRPKEDVRGYEQGSIVVSSIEPPNVTFKIEPKEHKKVPVTVDYKGTLPKGLELYDLKLSPSEVEIKGPQSQVNKINVLKTETINLFGQKKSFRISAEVPTGFDLTQIITPTPVMVDFIIGERREVKRIDQVRVLLKGGATGIRLVTSYVDLELYGPPSKLNKLTRENIFVNASINDLNKTSATPEVVLPEPGVEVKNVFPKEVKFTVRNR